MSAAGDSQAAPTQPRGARSAGQPVAAPVDTARQAWADARAMADAGDYEGALVVVRRGLANAPDQSDLLWLEAGCIGWAGRHAEAVRRYEQLIVKHPELAGEVRTDLATQRLWAGDPRGALRDLNARLLEEPGDHEARAMRALALSHADLLVEALAAYDSLIAASPGDVSLVLERARVLMWMDRNTDAANTYRDLLAREPGNREAQLGIARVQNATGLHRHAIATLAPLAAEAGADPEVLKALAFAHYWSGDPARARTALGGYRAQHPADQEGLDLETRIRRDQAASLTLGYSRSDDSDGLRVGTTSMELRLPLGARNAARLGWQRDNVSDAQGTRDPLQWRAGLERIWSAQWQTRASLSIVDFGSQAGTPGHGELGLTWRPEDRYRIDGGVSRDDITTRRALALGISAQTWVAGVDVRPSSKWLLHADARQRFFSDENRSQAETGSARCEVWSQHGAQLTLQARVQQLRTRLDLDHGYYDPAQYFEWGPGAAAEWSKAARVTVSGELWGGWQRERNAQANPLLNASGRIEWVIERYATLSLEGGRSNSNLQSASGYERRQWAVSIARGF